jgi:hypothetical protein
VVRWSSRGNSRAPRRFAQREAIEPTVQNDLLGCRHQLFAQIPVMVRCFSFFSISPLYLDTVQMASY